jgi:hypothetical protein
VGYNTVQYVEYQPTFRKNISPPSLGSKNNPSSAFYLFHAGFLLGLFFDPEDVGDMLLLNVS